MEIFREDSQPLYLKVYYNRALTDASTTPTVSLELNGNALSAHTVTHEAEGIYSIQLKYSDLAEEGELKATWVFTVNSETVTKQEVHKVVTPYVDLGYLYELDKTEEEQLDAERYARYAIERYTGQKFGKRSGWQKVQGNGTDILILTDRIIDPQSVYENGKLAWESGGTENAIFGIEPVASHFGVRAMDNEDPIEHYSTNSLYKGGRFIEGFTYEVVGTYGYDNVPDDIMFAGKMLVDDFFCQDRTWREKWAKSVKSGDWSVDIDSRVFSGTGNSYVDAMLDDYTWHRMVII